MFYYWHKYQSLTVSSVVGAPWRCGVLTTQGETSPDCIIVVVVAVVVFVVVVLVKIECVYDHRTSRMHRATC